jgi:hypothetical protein
MVCNTASFWGEELLAPHPTLKLDDHLSSAVRDYLVLSISGARSSIRKLRTRHAMLTAVILAVRA